MSGKMSSKSFLKLILVFLVALIGCKDPTGPGDDIKPPVIHPTEGKGPGGPAYIAGNIKDYVHPSQVVLNTHIYVMNQQNYSDTLAHVFVTSVNASFRITDLPEGKVDLIFMNENYLCAKIGKLMLNAGGNSFFNPSSGGYFVDSTIFITNIADSIGRPDAPEFGLLGYGPTFTVYFKWETSDSLAREIVLSSSCDTLKVFTYNDPVFDPYENDVYNLKVSQINSIVVKLKFFNWLKEVKEASPDFMVIQ
jgi:hypothetical protein